MIFVAGISIAFFISALLLVKKNKSRADYILFLWVLLVGIHLSFHYIQSTGIIYDYPLLIGMQFPFPFLHGVLLYFYVSLVTNQSINNKVITSLHFIPILLTYLYLIPFFLLPSNEKIEIFKSRGQGYETFQAVLLISVILSGILYVVWSTILLRKHNARIREEFSDIEDINLSWLQLLVYGLGAIWVLVIISQNDTLVFYGVSVFVILIGFFGVQQKNIFNTQKPSAKLIEQDSILGEKLELKREKYTSSGLSEELADQLYNNLNYQIKEQKVYTDSDLSLKELATKLGTHPNYLSQVINAREGKSFYDYINTYRIEEFKRLLSIPKNQQFTLIALAYDCGFNSKSSFNRYFKKISGETPSNYAKSIIST